MTKQDYNKLVKMYDGLKAVNKASADLSPVIRMSVDFAVLLATKEALKAWDMDNNPHENFTEFLTSEIAQAQYDCAEIIAKREKITN